MAKQQGEKTLEQRAAELRAVIEKPSAKELAQIELARIEREMTEAREATARAAAEERLVGIRRACGSVAASLTNDEQRVRSAAKALADAVTRMNERYAQIGTLKVEADALCHRFGIGGPDLPAVTPPARRAIAIYPVTLSDHARPIHEVTARCEYGMRQRRTYGEVAGSEGFAIIEEAGLLPFPALTEHQQRIVEAREREQQHEGKQKTVIAGEAEATVGALAAVGAVGIRSL